MSLPPFDLDLELFAPDALELLDVVDDSGGGASTLLGAVNAAEDFDPGFLSELLEVTPPSDSKLAALSSENSYSTARNEPSGLESMDTDTAPESGHPMDANASDSAASSPSSSTSQGHNAQAGASSGANQEEEEDSPQVRRLRRRAMGSRLLRERKKNEMEELRKESVALEAHLDLLRSNRKKLRSNASIVEWEERAIALRHRRHQAEELNHQLKRALYEQRRLVGGLLGVLSDSPLLGSELNLHRILHTYIRLGTHPRGRLRAFQSICTESRLDLALQVVDRETENVPFDKPNILTQQLQTPPTECGVTTVAVYAFQTTDVNKIFSDACLAIVGARSEKPNHTMTSMRAEVADEPSPQIRYAILDAAYTSDITGEEFHTSSRVISFYRITDEYAVLLWDFVDVDDLNPVRQGTHIKSDVVGAVVVRREVCADSVERVVCRYVCTKMHRLNRFMVTSSLERFLVSGAQLCTHRVYQQIKERNPATRQVAISV